MRVKQAIRRLQHILVKQGNVELLVYTEAGKFPCHMVDVRGIYVPPPESGMDDHCYVVLDEDVMSQVHPGIEYSVVEMLLARKVNLKLISRVVQEIRKFDRDNNERMKKTKPQGKFHA